MAINRDVTVLVRLLIVIGNVSRKQCSQLRPFGRKGNGLKMEHAYIDLSWLPA